MEPFPVQLHSSVQFDGEWFLHLHYVAELVHLVFHRIYFYVACRKIVKTQKHDRQHFQRENNKAMVLAYHLSAG